VHGTSCAGAHDALGSRARVVGIFLNEASVVRLVGAVLTDNRDDWQAGDRRELSAVSMSKLDPECDTGAVAELIAGG
jgi:transposase-like protein